MTQASLTARQSEVVNLLTVEGLSQTETAERLGVSLSVVNRIVHREDVQAELVSRSRSALSAYVPKAVRTVADLASSAKSEYVKLQAAVAILDRVGLSQPDQSSTLAIQINLDTVPRSE